MFGLRWLALVFAFASLEVAWSAPQAVPEKWPEAKADSAAARKRGAETHAIVVRNQADVERVAAELRAALVAEIGAERAKGLEPALAVAVDQVTRSMGEFWPEEDLPPSDGKSRRWHETVEIVFSLSVLVASGAVLGLLAWLRSRRLISAGLFLKLFVLVSVIASGVFVITAGYDQEQIGPMMGLLGTLVGYLLGKQEPKPPPEPVEAPPEK